MIHMADIAYLIFLLALVAFYAWADHRSTARYGYRNQLGAVLILAIGVPLAIAIWAISIYLKALLVTP